jgi:hypothetical protein
MRALVLLAACADPYVAGTLPRPVHQVGCLDVAILRGDVDGHIGYRFGNRCEHSVRVDLGVAHIVGLDRTGRRVAMVAFDPAHEIGPRDLDARAHGEQWIEYDPPVPIELWALEVDVGDVAAGDAPIGRIERMVLRR